MVPGTRAAGKAGALMAGPAVTVTFLAWAAGVRVEPLTAIVEGSRRIDEPPGLLGVDDAPGINGLELARLGPRNRLERIAGTATAQAGRPT
jgi:hypothetical protein